MTHLQLKTAWRGSAPAYTLKRHNEQLSDEDQGAGSSLETPSVEQASSRFESDGEQFQRSCVSDLTISVSQAVNKAPLSIRNFESTLTKNLARDFKICWNRSSSAANFSVGPLQNGVTHGLHTSLQPLNELFDALHKHIANTVPPSLTDVAFPSVTLPSFSTFSLRLYK